MLPFASFTLDHFRGLAGLSLAELGRINILVGANNSGKSSVLEAIELACDPLEPWSWLNVADQRDTHSNAVDRIDNVLWMFPQTLAGDGHSHPIHLSFSGSTAFVALSATVDIKLTTTDANEIEYQYDLGRKGLVGTGRVVPRSRRVLSLHASAASRENPSRSEKITGILLTEGEPYVAQERKRSKLRTPCASIAPLSHRTRSIHAERLSSAKESGLVGEAVALLQQFDPDIQDLDILARQGTFADLRIRHKTLGLAPLNAFGDGMRRALLYALTVPQVRGGVLLIDEIESAIHVKALGGVFAWLTRACTQFDVQLFASTHSLEALESLLGDDPEATARVVGYHLPNRSSETTVTRYEGELLARLVRDRGLDVR